MTKQGKQMMTELSACQGGRAWFDTQKNPKEAWNTCQRSDWMLWALQSLGYDDKRILRLIACACIRETPLADGRNVWDLLTDERSRFAVEVAERYANGEATESELTAARDAAWAAWAAAWAAARDAARAAAWDAAWAAAWAAWAATRASARAASDAASDDAWAAQSDIIRRFISWDTVSHLISKKAPK